MFILLSGIFIFGFIGIWVAVIGGLIKESKNVPKPQTPEEKQKQIEETDELIKLYLLLFAIIGFTYFMLKL